MVTLPEPFASIPRHPLLLPTPSPIHLLPRTSADLGVPVYAKREDLNSALAFGGNKTRKLEYLLADALSTNCTTLVSIGGFQSNHTRQVSGAAAATGLKCKLVQEKWVDWEEPYGIYDKVGNIQLSRMMDADIRLENSGFGIEHKGTLKKVFEECVANGEKPYYIPAGASDHPLGGLGFARWAFEVREQEQAMGVFFDTIIVCAVTGSTMSGMVAGFKLLERMYPGETRKVVGIDASAKPAETRAALLKSAKETAVKIGLKDEDITADDIILDERYHAGTYGIPDKQTLDAIEYGARMDAFITDPVYEGKSLAGMIDMIKKGEISGGNVLYAHLGGQLALNAYPNMKEFVEQQA
ncbi:hypothetical protein H072_1313 [Dactylellina haptotyla CBS 200.50]|uniref:Tryptophan synthase beta chain-like PALP domain-containing protein n=1 Tax=Dactylellina haptotyla (strain CBS 200.50) TaxID=1284197 RepID=S8CAC6_DACHA|nr:hypothetical protein H072_1313 [Dactylellina haptotyla CBS 200.50]